MFSIDRETSCISDMNSYKLHPTIIMPTSYPHGDFRVLSVIYHILPCTNWSIFNVPAADITSRPIVKVLRYRYIIVP